MFTLGARAWFLSMPQSKPFFKYRYLPCTHMLHHVWYWVLGDPSV